VIPPAVSVIVAPCDESSRDTGDIAWTVMSLVERATERISFEIVVVDDGSIVQPREFEAIPADVPLYVKRAPTHGGPSHPRNVGARASRGRILVFIDAGVAVSAEWDRVALEGVGPDRMLTGSVRSTEPGSGGHGRYLEYPSLRAAWLRAPRADGFAPIASDSAIACTKELFLRSGGYDEALPSFPAASVEHSIRSWLTGATIALGTIDVTRRSGAPQRGASAVRVMRSQALRDQLRLALLYFDGPELNEIIRYYGSSNLTETRRALESISSLEIQARRAWLRPRLVQSATWWLETLGATPAAMQDCGVDPAPVTVREGRR
jgi:glycosyltransferase involved in cell wall biosynthesis